MDPTEQVTIPARRFDVLRELRGEERASAMLGDVPRDVVSKRRHANRAARRARRINRGGAR